MKETLVYARLTVTLFIVQGLTIINPVHATNNNAAELFQLCATCHGSEGLGKKELNAPSLAGLPEWYLVNQLKKFREGIRGAKPEDPEGLRMHPMARTLDTYSLEHNRSNGRWKYTSDREIKSVSKFISNLTPKLPENTLLEGNHSKGKNIYMSCMGCHGQNLAGNEAIMAPPLTYIEDWYMLEQLKKFKKGLRGNEQFDTYDQTSKVYISAVQATAMRGILKVSVHSEKRMTDVISYIRFLAKENATCKASIDELNVDN